MSNTSTIEHRGTVVAIDGVNLKVEIINYSACASCSAANMCTAAESKAKIVDVVAGRGETYNVGDVVDFVGDESMGFRAIAVAYVLPMLLLVAGLVCGKLLGFGDAGIALCALAPLVPFYLGLYLLRNKVDRHFKFKTKNQ